MPRPRLQLAVVLLVPLLAVGCYESRDAPPAAYRDGGGAQPGDAAAPADAAVATDAGGVVRDAAGEAPQCGDVIAPYAGSGCSEATRTCLQRCGGEPTCSDECIASDAQCALCVDTTLARCANEAGCQAAWDTFACCAREQRACETRSGLPLLACADACEGELIAYDRCVSGVAEPCIGELLATCGLAP